MLFALTKFDEEPRTRGILNKVKGHEEITSIDKEIAVYSYIPVNSEIDKQD